MPKTYYLQDVVSLLETQSIVPTGKLWFSIELITDRCNLQQSDLLKTSSESDELPQQEVLRWGFIPSFCDVRMMLVTLGGAVAVSSNKLSRSIKTSLDSCSLHKSPVLVFAFAMLAVAVLWLPAKQDYYLDRLLHKNNGLCPDWSYQFQTFSQVFIKSFLLAHRVQTGAHNPASKCHSLKRRI